MSTTIAIPDHGSTAIKTLRTRQLAGGVFEALGR
jgi:hypothetical protein